MGVFLFVLTLAIEGAGVAFSYWYGVHFFGSLLAFVYDGLFPTRPLSLEACGLVFLSANLSGHAIALAWSAVRLLLSWHRLGIPSARQEAVVSLIYSQALASYPSSPLRAPAFRFSPDPDLVIGWVGPRLVIRDSLLKSQFLPTLLMHELAHYNSADVWLRFLLELLPPPLYGFLALCGLPIGLGPLLLYFVWNWYWRNREYTADAFVAQLGYGEALIEALEQVRLPRDRERHILLRDAPYGEERIHRLQQWQRSP
jgi:Zn-dependent protease with chaperone function